VRLRPVSPDRLAYELAERIAQLAGQGGPERWLRVGIDGADAARPAELADSLVDLVQVRGRPVVRVRAEDHLRPASLRFERGRSDPDSFYEDWLDADGLRREVLDPLESGGSGRIRPVRWDADADRASRAGFVVVPPGGVLILSGPLLLGQGLALEFTVHLDLSQAALARRSPEGAAWTLPAYDRYRDEVGPALLADVVVRADDARHPAVLDLSSEST
jgi:hypothetical protein